MAFARRLDPIFENIPNLSSVLPDSKTIERAKYAVFTVTGYTLAGITIGYGFGQFTGDYCLQHEVACTFGGFLKEYAYDNGCNVTGTDPCPPLPGDWYANPIELTCPDRDSEANCTTAAYNSALNSTTSLTEECEEVKAGASMAGMILGGAIGFTYGVSAVAQSLGLFAKSRKPAEEVGKEHKSTLTLGR